MEKPIKVMHDTTTFTGENETIPCPCTKQTSSHRPHPNCDECKGAGQLTKREVVDNTMAKVKENLEGCALGLMLVSALASVNGFMFKFKLGSHAMCLYATADPSVAKKLDEAVLGQNMNIHEGGEVMVPNPKSLN